jgi:hypothetical protein
VPVKNGGRPPPRDASDDLPIEQLPGELNAETKTNKGWQQAVKAARRHDLNAEARAPMMAAAYRLHFRAFARTAARDALRAAIQTETAPDEIADFYAWRLEYQVRRFGESFVDFWSFDPAFRQAAIRTAPRRPGGAP